jgi:endonuclease YncB( thermonuclease family)
MPRRPGQKRNYRAKRGSKPVRRIVSPRNLRILRNFLILLAAVSLYQYVRQGEVTWHADVLEKLTATVGDYAGRPDASWKKATDVLEDLGARKEGDPLPEFDLTGRVVRIADGDTISILDRSRNQHRIRLYGIDTPEWDQPHGKRAKNALTRLLERKTVGVVIVNTDRLGRTVATVYLDGININATMVQQGHAWWYQKYAPHNRLLEVAQRQAREQQLGLWSKPDPTPPWIWRRQHPVNKTSH